tara:strand:- start:429 stop:653 length:225 start_codon:yes stop_codon:yes gene_type:complete
MEQMIIAATGALAIFLTQQRNAALQKYACLVGMAGQPFWLMATYQADQAGMFALSAFYTLTWAMGVWTHWIRPA